MAEPTKPQNGNYRNDLSAEFVRSILTYDPATGIFTWKRRNDRSVSWNAKYAQKIAGTADPNGYILIGINKKRYLAHRLAWLYMTGEWPRKDVDHKIGGGFSNKWSDLREATHAQNSKNKKLFITNTSGFTGVTWHKKNKKWVATITCDFKRNYLGSFVNKRDAVAAYEKAAKDLFGPFKPERTHLGPL